jgi:hypothetical protein
MKTRLQILPPAYRGIPASPAGTDSQGTPPVVSANRRGTREGATSGPARTGLVLGTLGLVLLAARHGGAAEPMSVLHPRTGADEVSVFPVLAWHDPRENPPRLFGLVELWGNAFNPQTRRREPFRTGCALFEFCHYLDGSGGDERLCSSDQSCSSSMDVCFDCAAGSLCTSQGQDRIAFHPNGTRYVLTQGNTLYTWDSGTRRKKVVWKAPTDEEIQDIDFAADGTLYAVAGGQLRRIDLARQQVFTVNGSILPGDARGLDCAPDGFLYVAGGGGMIYRVDPSTGAVVRSYSVPQGQTLADVALTPDNFYDIYLDTAKPPKKLRCSDLTVPLFSCGQLLPNTTYYWQVVKRETPGGAIVDTGPIWSFRTTAHPVWELWGSTGLAGRHPLRLVKLSPVPFAETPIGKPEEVLNISLDFAPDGTLYGIGTGLWTVDPRTGTCQVRAETFCTTLGDKIQPLSIACDPNGVLYGIALDVKWKQSKLYRIDVATGIAKELWCLPWSQTGDDAICGIDFAADGVLYGAHRGLMKLDLAAKEVIPVSLAGLPCVGDLDWAPDGFLYATGNVQGMIYKIDPATGTVSDTYGPGASELLALASRAIGVP